MPTRRHNLFSSIAEPLYYYFGTTTLPADLNHRLPFVQASCLCAEPSRLPLTRDCRESSAQGNLYTIKMRNFEGQPLATQTASKWHPAFHLSGRKL